MLSADFFFQAKAEQGTTGQKDSIQMAATSWRRYKTPYAKRPKTATPYKGSC
jgi:hypothetical protein